MYFENSKSAEPQILVHFLMSMSILAGNVYEMCIIAY